MSTVQVEIIMQDSALARARPSSIAHAVYEAIKVMVTIL